MFWQMFVPEMEIPAGYILITESKFKEMVSLISRLEKRVAELESQLNKSSNNSSKPPSSDGLKKAIKNNREKSNRKPGGQPGHKGSGLSMSENPDEVIRCKVEKIKCDCGLDLRNVKPGREEKRQVIDIVEIMTKVIDYLVEVKKCRCGKEHKGVCNFNGRVQYGHRLKSLLTYLNVYQMLPVERIQELCRDIFGLSIGDGTIQSSTSVCYENLQQTEKEIREQLIQSAVINNDETGIRCQGQTQWIHSASNEQYTLYGIHHKRGNQGIDALGIMENYLGVSVHDRWASYDKYANCTHALCNAHLLRDLKFMHEEEGKKWAGRLKEVLQSANKRKQEGNLTNHYRTRIKNQITALVLKALRNEPKEKNNIIKRGRKPKSKPIRLLEVFKNRIDDVLLFLYRVEVPFDNNLAERDLRMIKLKQKISGCFRSNEGAKIFCRIRSYISTSRKQGLNIWNALSQAMAANPVKFNFVTEQ